MKVFGFVGSEGGRGREEKNAHTNLDIQYTIIESGSTNCIELY